MPIAAPVNQSQQIRNLKASGLTPADIADVTGFDAEKIKAALRRTPRDKPKSRPR